MTYKTLTQLVADVEQWAVDRGLDQADPAKQLEKTAAELIELAVAVGKDSAAPNGSVYANEVIDGIGDVLVTLIIVTQQLGMDLTTALQFAYDEIKDRKGKLINGIFVKEADLPAEEVHEFNGAPIVGPLV